MEEYFRDGGGEEGTIPSTSCKPSLITDYYSPRARRVEQIVWDEEDGEGVPL